MTGTAIYYLTPFVGRVRPQYLEYLLTAAAAGGCGDGRVLWPCSAHQPRHRDANQGSPAQCIIV